MTLVTVPHIIITTVATTEASRPGTSRETAAVALVIIPEVVSLEWRRMFENILSRDWPDLVIVREIHSSINSSAKCLTFSS